MDPAPSLPDVRLFNAVEDANYHRLEGASQVRATWVQPWIDIDFVNASGEVTQAFRCGTVAEALAMLAAIEATWVEAQETRP